VDSGRNASYSYDALYRLSTAVTTGSTNYSAWGLQESYDRYGNRTVQKQTTGMLAPQITVSVDPTTNHITGTGYGYDASGNMTNDGYNTLTYDAENRATKATNQSTAGEYAYDGNNRRVKKCVPSCAAPQNTTTVYIFSGSKVIAEYDNGVAVTSPSREYVYGGTSLIAKIDSSGTKYYHQDHLSNRLVTSSTGATVSQSGHYPFGEAWYYTSNDKLFFTSYERDAESGNDYAMARYYASRLARFISSDKVAGSTANPQSLNRYTYALNLPGTIVDPSGNCGEVDASRRRKRLDYSGGHGRDLFADEWEEYAFGQDDSINCIDPSIPGGGGVEAGAGATGDPMKDCGAAACLCTTAANGDFLGCQAVDYCSLPQVSCAKLDPPPALISIWFSGGVSGGTGGNNRGRDATIRSIRSLLYDQLLKDPDCLAFLGARGVNVLQTLSTIPINVGNIGAPNYQAVTVADINPSSTIPVSATITINSNGWFFTPGGSSSGINTGTQLFQGLVLYHELGHATNVLRPDGDGIPNAVANQAANSSDIKKNCAKALAGLSNSPTP